MERGMPLDTPVGAPVLVLANEAFDGTLAVCGGAGVSMPAGLPSGRELARRLHARFQNVCGYACAEPDDLLAVADAAANLPDGLSALQSLILDLAPFSDADPDLGHRLLALLVAEGALRLLLTNWDDCVERSWRQFEWIPAARNATDAENLRGQFVLKIHGCCSQPATLLITSEQLDEAPLWTKIYFEAELARSTMVFLGIGDVAEYARRRVTRLAELVDYARVRLVAPDINSGWEGSTWQALLANIPSERRIERTADEFLDELAREWVRRAAIDPATPPGGSAASWFKAISDAFVLFSAVEALAWFRRAAYRWRVGASVARAPGAGSALEALGRMAEDDGLGKARTVRFLPASAVLLDEERIDVVLCQDRLTPSEIEDAATHRAQRAADGLGSRDELHVLIAAAWVRGPRPRLIERVSVVDPNAPIDALIGGDRQVAVRLTYADEIIEAAA
jgi:SIR2-like domain